MIIPLFERLDGSKNKIQFRAPTVADCRNYCGMLENKEQAVVTSYLSDLQVIEKNSTGALDDPLSWTINDRMLALYWIYIATRSNKVITQSYPCQHCDEEHGRQLDLTELSGAISLAKSPMKIAIKHPEIKAGFIVPMRGYGLEHIEDLRNDRDEYDEDSSEWRLAHTDMRLYEAAYHLEFEGDDFSLSPSDLAKSRYEYLLSLQPDTHYQPLSLEVRKAIITMHHGLSTSYFEGQINLVTRPHNCPVKEGSSTNLLLPFHCHEYIPTL